MTDDDFMADRLHSLLNPDQMHPVGCSSWVDEAAAFLEILDSSYMPLVRNDAPFAEALRLFIDQRLDSGRATKVDVVLAMLLELRRLNDQKTSHEVMKVFARPAFDQQKD